MMNIFEAIVLGLVQGLTEFIPVSSSGHLVIAQTLMTGAGDHLFLEWINIGTVLALIIFFRKRITDTLRDIFVKRDYRLAVSVIIAMLPAGLAGFFLASFIADNAFFVNIWTVTVSLVLFGVALILLEKLPKLSPIEGIERLPKSRALGIGLAQMLALIPGTSRSATTIIAGRISGLSRANAAEFSFLVSIPLMLGVVAKLLMKSSDRAYLMQNIVPLTVANLAAFVSGLLAVGFLMRFLEKKSLAVFGWYRIGLALVIVLIFLVK